MGRWWVGSILAALTLSALFTAGVVASGRLTKYSDKLGGHSRGGRAVCQGGRAV